MTTVVRIKRRAANDPLGPGAPAPGTLMNAELAFNEVDNTLYYGSGEDANGNATAIIPIGGDGAGLPEAPSDTVTYGRKDVDWEPVLPLAGGAMTGLLTIDSVAGVAGTDGGTTAAGGNVDINAGDGTAGGRVRVYAGDGTTSGGGSVSVRGGQGTIGGGATLAAGKSTGVGNVGGNAAVTGGFVDTGTGGNVTITSGSASVSGNSGNVVLDTGTAIGGVRGDIRILNLSKTAPDTVADPMKVDTVWNNNGVLNIGAGGAGGDFLPLTGGVLTGPLTLENDGIIESQINGTRGGIDRWRLVLGNTSVEDGNDRGTDFAIARFADNGDPLGTALQIFRQTGQVQFSAPPLVNGVPIGSGEYLPLTGGVLTGTLELPAADAAVPLVPTQAVNKQWLDWKLAPPMPASGFGADVVIQASDSTGALGGGMVTLTGGESPIGIGGYVTLRAGSGGLIPGELGLYGCDGIGAFSVGGPVNLWAGDGLVGGNIRIRAGGASGDQGLAGAIEVIGGAHTSTTTFQSGGFVRIAGGSSVGVASYGGNVAISGGEATASIGGSVAIEPGIGALGNGDFRIANLRTTSGPSADVVWNNNGVLNIGAGGAGGGGGSTVTTDGVTITGDGAAATPIALLPSVFGAGITFATNIATVNTATAADIATGTLDTAFTTPLGLRSQLGADAATLVTTAKTVIPGINEIYNTIAQLTGVVIYAGTYDATTSTGTYNGQGGIAAGSGALPAPAAANHGAYVMVTVAGPGGVAPEPAGPIAVGDWLISDGTAWSALKFGQAFAAYVSKAGDTMTGALSLPAAVWTTSLTATQAVNKQWLDWKLDPPDSVILGPTTRLSGGGATGAGGSGGAVTVRGGAGGPGGLGGRIDITSGSSSGPASSSILIQAGESTNATSPIAGGDVFIRGGVSVSNAASVGGNIILEPGQGAGAAWGDIIIPRLKTTAQAADVVWNNAGVLNIGAGGAGGLTDAPSDTFFYGRTDAAWVQGLPLTGGTLTGPVLMTAASSLEGVPATSPLVTGEVSIIGGSGVTAGRVGGLVTIAGGAGGTGQQGGGISIVGGASAVDQTGSEVVFKAGDSLGTGVGGTATIKGGESAFGGTAPNGPVQISGASNGAGPGGSVQLFGGNTNGAATQGGDIELNIGENTADAAYTGLFRITRLRTTPHADTTMSPGLETVWNNNGVLNIGAGGASGGGGIPEPVGAGTWGRLETGAWESVVPLTGGTMTGALTINAGLTVAPPAATSSIPVAITAGAATGALAGGAVAITGGTSVDGTGGMVTITGGVSNTDLSGGVDIRGANGARGGGAVIAGGDSSGATSLGGSVALSAGDAAAGSGQAGGAVTISAGSGDVCGNITLTAGQTGAVGNLFLRRLPVVAQPTDAIWNNNGVLNIGAGGTSGGGISEAPDDTFSYGRMGDGAGAFTWEQVMPLTGGNLIGPVTTTSTLTLFADPVLALEAVTKQYADNIPIMDGGTY